MQSGNTEDSIIELTKTIKVETSYINLLSLCYTIARQLPSPIYAVAMSLYQMINCKIQNCCYKDFCGYNVYFLPVV